MRRFFSLVLMWGFGFFLYLCYLFINATYESHFMSTTEQTRISQKLLKSMKTKEAQPLSSTGCASSCGRQIGKLLAILKLFLSPGCNSELVTQAISSP